MGESKDRPKIFSQDDFQYDKKKDYIAPGAFGDVYRAKMTGANMTDAQDVALKVLPMLQLPKEHLDILFKEVAVLQQLTDCPNVVHMKGLCVSPGHYALVMEYVENRDLAYLLSKKKDHPVIQQWPCRIGMALDIARAMHFLHNRIPTIIHGDLKSENVLVDGNYRCKITAFGLSETRSISSCTLVRLLPGREYVDTGGTLAFVAPERFKGDATSSQHPDKADVYGFAIVLWQLKEMKQPYCEEKNRTAIRENVMAGVRPLMSSDRCPKQFKDLIPKCWGTIPQTRPDFDGITKILETTLQSWQLCCHGDTRSLPPLSPKTVSVAAELPSSCTRGPRGRNSSSHETSREGLSSEPLNAVSARENDMTEQRNRSPKFPPICTRTLDHLNAAAATNTTTTIPKETPSSSTDQRTVRLAPVLELTAGASVRTKKQLFAPLRSSDEDSTLSETLSPSRKRFSDTSANRRTGKHVERYMADERKWTQWPDLPVYGTFHHRAAANESTVVVADRHKLYSCMWKQNSRWAELKHDLGSDVELHKIFTAGASWFAAYVKRNEKQGIATFNLTQGTWKHACDLPSYKQLQNYSVTGNEHYAYIVGGENKTREEVCDTVWKYDLNVGKLCGTGKLKSNRKSGSVVIIDDTLCAGGGSDGKSYLRSVEKMDVRQFEYSGCLPQTPTYRCSLSSVGSWLIATGGSDPISNSQAVNNAWKLSSKHASDSWKPLPGMNAERCYHGMCENGRKFVVVGGIDSEGETLKSVESTRFC